MNVIFPTDLSKLAGREFACSCGRTHRALTQKIVIEQGAIHKVFESGLTGKPFVIADSNTWPLGGDVFSDCEHYIFDGNDLHADEFALGCALIEMPADADYLIALGAGTIGDITRELAFKVGKPFVNVCTAPSMDGIASPVAPLIHNECKLTYAANPPYAIYCDLDIMKDAPMPMLAAGYGDMAGKYIARFDWEVSQIVTDEHFCQELVDLTASAVKKCEDACPGLPSRDIEAIRSLAEGLTLSAMCMQFYGDSRPASGGEHYYSHLWETQAVRRHKPVSLHGDKVGIGTLMAIDLYHEFFREKRMPKQASRFDMDAFYAHYDELKAKVDALYAGRERIARNIEMAGGPTHPRQLGISDEDTRFAFYNNFVDRPRVTFAHVLNETGLLDECVQKVLPKWIG